MASLEGYSSKGLCTTSQAQSKGLSERWSSASPLCFQALFFQLPPWCSMSPTEPLSSADLYSLPRGDSRHPTLVKPKKHIHPFAMTQLFKGAIREHFFSWISSGKVLKFILLCPQMPPLALILRSKAASEYFSSLSPVAPSPSDSFCLH